MKDVYQQTKQEVIEKFGSAAGHTEENAKNLQKQYGENVLKEKGKKRIFLVFLEQFQICLL